MQIKPLFDLRPWKPFDEEVEGPSAAMSQVAVKGLWQRVWLLMTPQRATDCSLEGIVSWD